MLSRLGKLVLVVTGLVPVPAVCALNCLIQGKYWWSVLYATASAALYLLCFGTLRICRRSLRVESLKTVKVKPADKDVVAFIVAYLIAFVSIPAVEFKGELFTAICVLGIIFFTVYKAESFAFNPVLAWHGYHYYEVEEDGGMTYLLISKRELTGAKNDLDVSPLSRNMFLNVTSDLAPSDDQSDDSSLHLLRADPVGGARA